ncbi:DUF899 family protein [Amycolatopsis aidingensis]|uniref:DUF899 family protein n=1 Tax=Amycolatopsis aidingensis TaxID=2842453 RepID=UPI001C0BE1BB|nr:DUF899 family protein [Amycolatopsis aidingensis]
MSDSLPARPPLAGQEPELPEVVDRATWQARLDELRAREKAQTRESDAIAAARRRLPMVEMDPTIPLVGPEGPVSLLETFEGRSQLVVFYHMWHEGQLWQDQCEGCTFYTSQVRELSYLHSRDVTYAIFSQGPYQESVAYHEFMGWEMPWYSAKDSLEPLLYGRGPFVLACYLRQGDRVFETYWTTRRGVEGMAPTYQLLDLTPYGRQETWEDSPPGWPQPFPVTGAQQRTNGRPTAQWPRLAARAAAE